MQKISRKRIDCYLLPKERLELPSTVHFKYNK